MEGRETRDPGELQAEAARLSVPATVERVRSAIAGFIAAAETLPETHLRTILEAGETAEARIAGACARIVEDARWILHAAWMGYGPADPPTEYPSERGPALAKLHDSIESLFVHVLEAPADGNLEFRWEHPVYGELNWREWLLALAFDAETAEQDALAMGAAGS